MSLPSSTAAIFTVSRLNETVKLLLENEMGQLWVSGEISNFSQPASGHWYFTLKDNRAQVRCAMFRNSNRKTAFRPQNGQQVLVRASLTLYEPRGDYQLIAESMHPAGEGLLQQQFEQLKLKLAAEGLFDQAHKQPLPRPARCVGVITSATGAALHDIIQVMKRRDPSLPIIIYPTAVQGQDAVMQIVQAIAVANQRQECDVLIVGRGGGSLEDLWCFNDERLARAIYASQLPIISAVGHEVDVTIADFVADLRAPTPSAAAELVSDNQQERLRQWQSLHQRLSMAMDYYLAQRQQQFSRLQHRLQQQHPQVRLSLQKNQLVRLQHRISEAMRDKLRQALQNQHHQQQRLQQLSPLTRVHQSQQRLQLLEFRLQQHINGLLANRRQRLATACTGLDAVSPLATLARGYSITQTEQGQLLKTVTQTARGNTLKTRLNDGWVESSVTRITTLTEKKR
jgi:exodeoxyribonuclease VII large subunit